MVAGEKEVEMWEWRCFWKFGRDWGAMWEWIVEGAILGIPFVDSRIVSVDNWEVLVVREEIGS